MLGGVLVGKHRVVVDTVEELDLLVGMDGEVLES